MQTFTTEQVAEMTGTPGRTLLYWCKTGLIQPHTYQGRRRVQTYFSNKDIREIKLLKILRRHLSGQALRKALNKLRELGQNPLSSGKFLVVGSGKKDLIKVCNEREAISLIKEPGQLELLILNCLELQKELRRGGERRRKESRSMS